MDADLGGRGRIADSGRHPSNRGEFPMLRLLASLSVCCAAGLLLIGPLAGDFSGPADATAAAVDRTNKTDALPMPPAAQRRSLHRVAVIDVVGVRNASIIYRDREGQVLFRTDPLSNVTVVAKDTVLPEVTVRETVRTTVEEVPVKTEPAPPAKATGAPVGCETAFGPVGSRNPAGKIDRCLSDAGAQKLFAIR
jgi:hypothetical protein